MRRLSMAAGLIALAAGGCSVDDVLVYLADTDDAYALPDNHIPDALVTPVSLVSGDGTKLAAMFAAQPEPGSSRTILFLHGQAGHIDAAWKRVMTLWDLGFNVFVVDYRGYGMSEGEPSEAGLYADAAAAFEHLLGRDDIQADRITIFGYSMGTGVAAHLALSAKAHTLVLGAPYTSMTALVEGSTPYSFPANWLTDVSFDTLSRMPRITVPTIVAHGLDDTRIPPWMGREVLGAAAHGIAGIFLPDVDHHDLTERAGAQIAAAIGE